MSDDDILELPEADEPQRPTERRHILISKGVGTFLISAGFVSVVGLLVGAFQIAGVVNMGLAHLLIALAWAIAVFSVWLWLLSRPRKHMGTTVLLTACAFIIVFIGCDVLMVRLKAEQERSASRPTSASATPITALPSPLPTGTMIPAATPITSQTPIQQPFVVTTPMPSPTVKYSPTPTQITTSAAPLSVIKEIPFKGGSPRNLAALMKEAGYTGPTVMTVLYVRSSDENQNEILVGTRPDLNAKNSWRLEFGSEWFEFRGGEDTSRVYIYSEKDGKLDITYRLR